MNPNGLLSCRNEENAFWLLAALVEDMLHPGTYDRNLAGCQVSQSVSQSVYQSGSLAGSQLLL
jgi:hypothetical protein